jgi:hypothetical protein
MKDEILGRDIISIRLAVHQCLDDHSLGKNPLSTTLKIRIEKYLACLEVVYEAVKEVAEDWIYSPDEDHVEMVGKQKERLRALHRRGRSLLLEVRKETGKDYLSVEGPPNVELAPEFASSPLEDQTRPPAEDKPEPERPEELDLRGWFTVKVTFSSNAKESVLHADE